MTTVDVRSYSRYSGNIWCDSDTGTPSGESALATRRSCSGFANEKSRQTAIDSTFRSRMRATIRSRPARSSGSIISPAGPRALRDAEPQIAGDQRGRARHHKVINLRPCLAAYLDHVLKAFGRDEGRLRPLSLKQGVRGHGRAVDYLGRRERGLGQYALDARENRFGGVVRR